MRSGDMPARLLTIAWLLLTAGISISVAQLPRTGAGLGAPSSGPTFLLDSLSATPLVAYSTRKLRSAYAGNALQAQQILGGNPTQDIGFVSNNLDTTSLNTFVGAHNGGISIWYDQASSNNGPSASAGDDPLIVNAGTNNTENGHVCPNFTASDRILFAGSLTQAQPITLAFMFHPSGTPGGGLHDGTAATRVAVGFFMSQYILYAGGSIAGGGTPDGNAHTLIAVFNGGSSYAVLDGSTIITGINPGSQSYDSTTHTLGTNNASTAFGGNLCEFEAFIGDIGATDEATIRSSYQTYWGAP